jgi:hypothetical protein
LGLTLETIRLFPDVPPITPRPEFLRTLTRGATFAQGIDTEKARSEFVIAPLLLEFLGLRNDQNAIFSGIEFNIDPAAGLNGYCDFLITRSPRLLIVTAPVVAVAEAKNDNVNTGLGQCVATMRAAWLFNVAKGASVSQVYGATTTGSHWKFLRLRDTLISIDRDDYYLADIGRILGILQYMVETA